MNVLVTGGSGTLGKKLAEMFCDQCIQWIVYSRDEYKQSQMRSSLPKSNLRMFIGDIRDDKRLMEVFEHKKPDFVIHAAAMKQIDCCEYNPLEAVWTNVFGTANVIRTCVATGVKRAVFISTDKAVEPILNYGSTKLCAEHLWLSANVYSETEFYVVRYGNVMASRGSLLEVVDKCKNDNTAVPICDPRMTRFWMEQHEAAQLVWYVLHRAGTSQYPYVPTMDAMSIPDIVEKRWPGAKTTVVGSRAVEKQHELLVGHDELAYLVNRDFTEHKLIRGPIRSDLVAAGDFQWNMLSAG